MRPIDEAIADHLGERRDVLGGDIDAGGRIAWVEAAEGRYWLRTVGGPAAPLRLEVETYSPYFGCELHYLRWWGDDIVAIYREKHRTLVWTVPVAAPGSARLAHVGDDPVVHEDLVVFASDEPGLLGALAIPSLAPRAPLPSRAVARGVRIGADQGWVTVAARLGPGSYHEIERLRLPSAAQRGLAGPSLVGAIGRALGDPPPSIAALVTGCAAFPFWTPIAEPFATYHAERRRFGSVRWLPAYWHEHLEVAGRAAEAAELLRVVDAISRTPPDPERGWRDGETFEDGVLRLAVGHVRRRASAYGQVMRQRRLPEGQWDHLFEPLAHASRTPDLVGLPDAVAAVWAELVLAKPRSFSARGR